MSGVPQKRLPTPMAAICSDGPLAAVSRCSELSYETVRGLRPKSKTAWEHLHTAHDAQLEMPDRSGAEHKPVRRGREMIDLLAVEEPKPKPAKIRAVSYEAGIDQLFKRMRSSNDLAIVKQLANGPERCGMLLVQRSRRCGSGSL